MRRVAGEPPPWTRDPIIACHRFTNIYRASDRVSQFLIKEVIYAGPQEEEEVLFRILLFKIFNCIETWKTLAASEDMTWRRYKHDKYAKVLDHVTDSGRAVYNGAYLMASPPFGHKDRYRNHLSLVESLMAKDTITRVLSSTSMFELFNLLRSTPTFGSFLAFQISLDINYSELTHHDEMEMVVTGPGGLDGIQKCFEPTDAKTTDIIRWMTENAGREFKRLGLKFQDLWGETASADRL